MGDHVQQEPVRPATRALGDAEVAPEAVSPHQVAAMARILGLNPDSVVSIRAEQTHVDVVLYDPPKAAAGPAHPLLRELRYLVER